VREVGPHVCIKRDLSGRLLGGSQSWSGDGTGEKRGECATIDHGFLRFSFWLATVPNEASFQLFFLKRDVRSIELQLPVNEPTPN
jgi:hypothetical protein